MIKIAVAGAGAIGATVCRALIDGIPGFELVGASTLDVELSKKLINRPVDVPFMPLTDLVAKADWIVEALPAAAVPELARLTTAQGKTLVAISAAALLLYPEILKLKGGRILVPSGAIAGIDGITALAEQGIRSARITTTKPPKAYSGAPHVVKNNIDVTAIGKPTTIFTGHALEAAAAFPANVNVAATLTLASRLAPQEVQVEVRADPAMTSNRHEIVVEGDFSTLKYTIENKPDPANPKSSALTAQSIIALLRKQTAAFTIGS